MNERTRTATDEWQSLRQEVIGRDSESCQHCDWGYSDTETKRLEVHHVVPRRLFRQREHADNKKNLVTLCSTCHARWEKATKLMLKGAAPRSSEYRRAVQERIARVHDEGLGVLRESYPDIYEELRQVVCKEEKE